MAGLIQWLLDWLRSLFFKVKRERERDMLISNISLQTQHVLDGDGVDLGWSSEQW